MPGTRARDYLSILRLLRAAQGATIGEAIDCKGPLYDRLIGPLLLAALNTEPRVCAARRRRAGDPAQDAACAQTTLCDRSWPRLTIPIRLRLVRVGETAPGWLRPCITVNSAP